MVGDVFQERLDRIFRGMPNVQNIADVVLVDGKAEVTHEKSIITLLETARVNDITFICENLVSKSKCLRFFCRNLIPQGYKVDPKKVQANMEMLPP